THVPFWHWAFALENEHALPQNPQFCRSNARSVSHPLPDWPSQSPRPGAHPDNLQVPSWQIRFPPPVHGWLHAPQCCGSAAMFVSQPVISSPSQFANPVSQGPSVQVPALHVDIACSKLQAIPHPPQSVLLASVFVSQPSLGL